MKIIKCIQGSPEWFEARKGIMTASHSQAIASNGKGLETYCKKIVMEMFCEDNDNFVSHDMERGIELEPLARKTYFIENGNAVEEVGLVKYNDFFAASPDGLVAKDGLTEIKCMNNQNHFNYILDKKINTGWLWQMQGQLLATGRVWNDFVAYNPNFEKSLIVARMYVDHAMQEKLILGIESGRKLIIKYKELYEANKV